MKTATDSSTDARCNHCDIQHVVALCHARYVARAIIVIHSRETRTVLLEGLAEGDPLESVVSASLAVIGTVGSLARAEGLRIPPAVRDSTVPDVVRLLVEMGTAGGKLDLDEESISAAIVETARLDKQNREGGEL